MTGLMHGEFQVILTGSPLWEPDCRPHEVAIGDVGYIRQGRFCRLFNATLPTGDPRNEFGTPDGFETLILDERAIISRRLLPGALVSRSIVKSGADIEFNGRDRGAALIINSEGLRRDSEQRGAFKKYMLKHHNSWLDFANNPPNSRDIFLHDLVFVTGRDNTADWAVAAFTEKSTTGGISFQSGYTPLVNASFSIWGSWAGTRSMYSNCGPQIQPAIAAGVPGSLAVTSTANSGTLVCAAELNLYNQCIFIRGFKFMDRRSQVYGMVKLKVPGSSEGLDMITRPLFRSKTKLTTSSSGTSDNKARGTGNTWSTMSSISPVSPEKSQPVLLYTAEPEDFSPSELILAYILHNSDAKLAIVHDDDVSAIVKSCNEYTSFLSALLEVRPEIVVDSDGVGSTIVSGESSSKAPLSLRVNPSIGLDPEGLKTDIDALQTQLAEVRRKISLFQKTGAAADREALLCTEIEALRGAIGKNQLMEESTSTQPKDVRGGTVRKVKDFLSSATQLDSTLKRSKTSETSMSPDRNLEGGTLNRIPKNLPERLQALNDELAIIRKERIAAHANRGQLFQERDDLQKRLKELQENRRTVMERVKLKEEEENEKKRTEKAFKAECIRKDKQAKEQQQRLEARARLLERASVPAFLSERRDCNALLTYFSPMVAGTTADSKSTTTLETPSTLAATPMGTRRGSTTSAGGNLLDRNNINHPGPGWVPLQAKKKADEEFFTAKTNKKNSKSGNGQRSLNSNTGAKKINIPLTIMTLLSNCGITPPMTFSDIPTVINQIQRKLQWLDDHETEATASNLATMEASLPPLHLLA